VRLTHTRALARTMDYENDRRLPKSLHPSTPKRRPRMLRHPHPTQPAWHFGGLYRNVCSEQLPMLPVDTETISTQRRQGAEVETCPRHGLGIQHFQNRSPCPSAGAPARGHHVVRKSMTVEVPGTCKVPGTCEARGSLTSLAPWFRYGASRTRRHSTGGVIYFRNNAPSRRAGVRVSISRLLLGHKRNWQNRAKSCTLRLYHSPTTISHILTRQAATRMPRTAYSATTSTGRPSAGQTHR